MPDGTEKFMILVFRQHGTVKIILLVSCSIENNLMD
jgi:hypothetical protein